MRRGRCEAPAGWARSARGYIMAAGIVFVLAVTALATPVSDAGPQVWTFSEDPVGEPSRGWKVLSGTWAVQLEEDGRNRLLVQTGSPLPGFELPAILAPTPPVRHLRAAVKVKPAGTGAFETMGLILGWRDPGTMTIVRVEGTPGRIWLDRVQDVQRSLRAGYIAPLHQGGWNILRVTAQGDWLNLFLNGRFLGGVREDDPVPGRVGLMAGPGARVFLDDLEVEAPST